MSKAKEWGGRLEKLIEAYEHRIAELERQLAAKPSPPAPDGHEWQPVDADHPLTADDHRRMVRQRNGEEWTMAWGGDDSPYRARLPNAQCGANGKLWLGDPRPDPRDIVAVLRPKPAPEPPTPQPGELWESELVGGGLERTGEIVSTRRGLVCLLDFDHIGCRNVAFTVSADGILRSRNWLDRKLTRRVI